MCHIRKFLLLLFVLFSFTAVYAPMCYSEEETLIQVPEKLWTELKQSLQTSLTTLELQAQAIQILQQKYPLSAQQYQTLNNQISNLKTQVKQLQMESQNRSEASTKQFLDLKNQLKTVTEQSLKYQEQIKNLQTESQEISQNLTKSLSDQFQSEIGGLEKTNKKLKVENLSLKIIYPVVCALCLGGGIYIGYKIGQAQ